MALLKNLRQYLPRLFWNSIHERKGGGTVIYIKDGHYL